jgi:hypothetical protein
VLRRHLNHILVDDGDDVEVLILSPYLEMVRLDATYTYRSFYAYITVPT